MSTQDGSIYLRSRIAERRGRTDYGGPGGQWTSPPQFSKDGYVKWAESTRPAREGGAEKMPAEKQMPRRGGLGVQDLPQIVDDLTKFYNDAKVYAPKVKAVLRNKTVQSKIAKGKYAPQMNQIAEYMEMVGLGHMKHDEEMCRRVGGSKSFQEYALTEEGRSPSPEGGRIGMGDAPQAIVRMAKLHGGADKSLQEKLTEFGLKIYTWLKDNKATTKAILESPYLNEKNPLGATTLPKKIKGYMEMVGLGEGGAKAVRWNPKARKGLFGEDLGGLEEFEYEGKGLFKKPSKKEMALMAVKSAVGRGGRAPSEYALFVKDFARKHPGPDLMKRAGAAWRSR